MGKSTFFNAATSSSVPTANFPFTTINPNVGIAYLRVNCMCRELGIKDNPINSRCIDGIRFIPVKLIDIAGLVPGAHTGRGLGNKFLDDARQSDVLIHVIDVSGSTDEEGRPIKPGEGDPLSDIKFVENEFDLWILSLISKDWDKLVRESENLKQRIETIIGKRLSGLSVPEQIIRNSINDLGLVKKPIEWNQNDLLDLCRLIRSRSKPIIIAANKADLPSSSANILKLKTINRPFFPCISEAELLLTKASQKGIICYLPGDSTFDINPSKNISSIQKEALNTVSSILKAFGSTGIQQVLNYVSFDIMNKIVVYPVEDDLKFSDKKGNVLPDAKLVPKNTTAKELANIIHTELGKGFIYAIDAKTKQRIGADHILRNNDIIKIVSSTTRN